MIAHVTKVSKKHPVGPRFEQEMSNAIYSRKIMPRFKSKQDFVSHRTPAKPITRRYSF